MIKQWRLFFASILSLTMTSQVFAVGTAGIGNEVPSARAAGQGYVGIAGQNEDPVTVYTNPAGITGLKGTQTTTGFHWENLHGGYEDDNGNKTKMRSIDAVVPNFAVTHSCMDGKLGLGLSAQSPYGLETHWPGAGSELRYVATNSLLHLVILSPAVAYQIAPTVSVGVGADYVNLFEASLEKNVNFGGGTADADSKLTGTAANWGYHTGVVFQPSTKHAFGMTYHSRVKLNINGTLELSNLSGAGAALFGGSKYQTSAYTDIYLPQNVQFGYAFKPTDKWMLEVDAAWYDWDPNHNIDVRVAESNPARRAVLNRNNPIPTNWRDAWGLSTGANYKATERLQVRGGFWYAPWIEPESSFSPALLDVSRYGLSVGLGYAVTANIGIDASYSAVFFHNRVIHNSIGTDATGIPNYANGTYSNFTNVIGLNFTYKFDTAK